MTPIRIKLFSAKLYDINSFNDINQSYNYIIEYHEQALSMKNVALTKDTDVVCIFVNDIINSEIIDSLHSNGVKILALRCAGFNNVDITSAIGKIHIVRVPAYSPHAVAEYALTMMLALNRKIHRAYCRTREDDFTLHGLTGFDMYGKTIGIIGTGKISKVLIPTLIAMGMNVVASDPYPDNIFAKNTGLKYLTNDELYPICDIISLHCPLTKDNYHMINSDVIKKFKQGIMIINTGRGQLINTTDLIEGLKSGIIGSAGLDVYEEEKSYFYEDRSDYIMIDDDLARLLSFNNVIVTSHQGFFTKEALYNIAKSTFENIRLGMVENIYPNLVNSDK